MTKDQYKGIWIFAEQRDSKLSSTVSELIAKALELKSVSGETVTAVLLGQDVGGLCRELFAYGAEEVIICEHEQLAAYSSRPYQKALTALAEKYRPSIILYGSTSLGCDLAPRMMVSLQTGLTADAIELGYDEDGDFYQTTPGYGGKILARIVIPETRPQMVTVRSGVFSANAPDYSLSGKLITEQVELDADDCCKVVGREAKRFTEKPLEQSAVVVSGGRGVRTAEELALLKELAQLIGAQVAGSRPLVDTGLLPQSVQIGQSGKTIKPEMIINVAISGSVQYKVGMDKSPCIISVNRATAAPLLDISNYGVVEDYRTFIPALIAEIKRRRK